MPGDRDLLAVTARAIPVPGPARIGRRDRTEGSPVLLVLRGLGLGDLLTSVPALRGLRRAFPGHRIVLAAPSALRELLPLIGAVDDLADTPETAVATGRITVDRPAVAVNLHGSGPQSIAALRRVRPGALLSHAHPAFPDVPGPPWRDRLHEVLRWCALLGWHGIAADPSELRIRVPRRRHAAADVVVHPGAASAARRWPPERYAAVAGALSRTGRRVVVTGTAAEATTAGQVAKLAGLHGDAVLAGRTGLAELAGLIGDARLVICGDTGVAHLATALGTASVVLFGPTPPALWGPPPGRSHVALWAGRRGDPHGGEPDPGLLAIDAGQVFDAARNLLERSVR
ncbi:glycosyl transferase [Microtetraspora sp. NBRC 13810]|uniref:glycosyltransferase family 9 protein n=1 Tax=Microtetraspora sp. NBRC 13810 TaxID=3030990 RepID=UPI0024A3ADE4|nr:glycosyltransferase family 9 protein [Microtetraspora sp. NBRC 13810]GLW11426.1 glycosyl transferase [Microtetraspora sp. NBRC 13810]